MTLRVRDIPPGVKFLMVRNGNKFTMIRKHEEKNYLFRVLRHPWRDRKGRLYDEQESIINGQSFVKPVIRMTPCAKRGSGMKA